MSSVRLLPLVSKFLCTGSDLSDRAELVYIKTTLSENKMWILVYFVYLILSALGLAMTFIGIDFISKRGF